MYPHGGKDNKADSTNQPDFGVDAVLPCRQTRYCCPSAHHHHHQQQQQQKQQQHGMTTAVRKGSITGKDNMCSTLNQMNVHECRPPFPSLQTLQTRMSKKKRSKTGDQHTCGVRSGYVMPGSLSCTKRGAHDRGWSGCADLCQER